MIHPTLRMNQAARTALLALGAFWVFGAAETALAQSLSGGGRSCKVRFDARTTEVTILDHSSSDNIPVGDITTKKPCRGDVVGTFTASLTGTIHIHEVWATCIDNAGLTGGCTAGTTVVAQPGHTLLQSNGEQQVSWPVVTARWIWPKLPSGNWRFRLYPAVFTPAIVKNSIFTIEAYD